MPTNINPWGISLKPKFHQERKEQRFLQKKNTSPSYVNSTVLEFSCKIHCDRGVFSLPNGEKPHGRYLYVRTLSGEIFIAEEGKIGHHSYLSNGKKVLSVGYFHFDHGKLCLVSNESGHYTPTNDEMRPELNFYYHLAQNEDLIYEDHSSVPSNKVIKHYRVREIIKKKHVEEVEPISSFVKTSNYGRELKKEPVVSGSVNQKEKTHYLPDFSLFKKTKKIKTVAPTTHSTDIPAQSADISVQSVDIPASLDPSAVPAQPVALTVQALNNTFFMTQGKKAAISHYLPDYFLFKNNETSKQSSEIQNPSL